MKMTGTAVRSAWSIAFLAGAVARTKSGEQAKNMPVAQTAADSEGAAATLQPALSPAAKTALDSGNALFRKTDYAGALEHYRLAAKESPEQAAGFFGIYMAALKLKNRALADSALAAMRERNVTPSAAHEPHPDSIMKNGRGF